MYLNRRQRKCVSAYQQSRTVVCSWVWLMHVDQSPKKRKEFAQKFPTAKTQTRKTRNKKQKRSGPEEKKNNYLPEGLIDHMKIQRKGV
jgi:hypothetical protein